MRGVFLRLEGIEKSFGGVKALKGVDLEIREGEIHCLAGENGCGKSTLIKVISGAHNPTNGKIFIEGKEVKNLTPIDAIRLGIQVIYQDFAVFPNLTVAENIAMNKALLTGTKKMDWKESRKLAISAMEQIGANIDPDILVERLSVANKQMVAICRAIINDAKLLILDEPTTALTSNEVEKLNIIIRKLKDKGIAVIIVNHKLDEIYSIAQYLTILRNGQNVIEGNIDEFDRPKFVKNLTGREISETNYRPQNSEEEVLRVEDLGDGNNYQNISFTLNKGDVLGITGLLGSGRSEIGESLFGINPYTTGRVFLNSQEIHIKTIDDSMKNKIAYVPSDRLTQGLFMSRSIQDNTIVSSIEKYLNKGKLNYKKIYDATSDWIEKIGCVAPSPLSKVSELSGGNAQKIVIAKWLNTDPNVLILNGPTVGVDIGAKSDIHKILHDLAADGVGIIIISDDLTEIIQNCNKVIIMNGGSASRLIDTSEIDETILMNGLSGNGEIVNVK